MKHSLRIPSIVLSLGAATLVHAQDLNSEKKLNFNNPSELVTAIEKLNDQGQEHPLAIETIEAAKASEDKAVQSALKQYQSNSKRRTPLAQWLPALHGGDAAKGKELFFNHPQAQCSTCHKGTVASNQLGPDLTGVSTRFNHSRRDLLASLVTPSSTIAEGYGEVNVEFEKGQITGKILAYKPSGVIVELDGIARLISHSDYKHINFEDSTMLSVSDQLNLREIRDLVAYLATYTGEPNISSTDSIQAIPFSLSELTEEELRKAPDESVRQKRLYQTNCAACHGMNGEGTETFPPLAKSEWVSGDPETLIQIQLRGLTGSIRVNGKTYDGLTMPSNAHLANEDLANILTYIRQDPSFGNNASAVNSEEIVEARATFADETGLLDASTLTHPDLLAEKGQSSNEPIIVKKEQDNESNSYLGYIIGFIVLCLIPVMIGFVRNNKPTS